MKTSSLSSFCRKGGIVLVCGMLLGLGACGDVAAPMAEEVFEYTDRVMEYGVDNGTDSRAAEVYGGTSVPDRLVVRSMTSLTRKRFIIADTITRIAAGDWTSNVTRYWPTEALDFYSHNDIGGTFDTIAGAPALRNVIIDHDGTRQHDFVYGTRLSMTAGPVIFGLKHGLCQVGFRVKCENPTLYVELTEVSVGGIAMAGDFVFPEDENSRGTWKRSSKLEAADVKLPQTVKIEGVTEPVSLTDRDNNSIMVLIPQETPAWTKGSQVIDGAYLSARVKVWNITSPDGRYNPDEDVCVWGGDVEGGRRIAVPVSVSWKANQKYVYTLVFSTSQLTSDPRDEAMVGQAITYGVTVESYQEAYNQDVDTSAGNTQETPGPDDPSPAAGDIFGFTWAQANLRSFDDSDNPGQDYFCPRFSYIPDMPLADQELTITRSEPRTVIRTEDDPYDYHFQWNRNFGFRITPDSYTLLCWTPGMSNAYEVYESARTREWSTGSISSFLINPDSYNRNDWATDNDLRPSWDSDGDPAAMPAGYAVPTFSQLTTLIPGGAQGQYTIPAGSYTVGTATLTPFHVTTAADGTSTYVWSRHTESGKTGLDLRRISGVHTLSGLDAAALASPSASVLLPASGHRDEVSTKGVRDTDIAGYYWSAEIGPNGMAKGITFRFDATTVSFDAGPLPRHYGCSLRLIAK